MFFQVGLRYPVLLLTGYPAWTTWPAITAMASHLSHDCCYAHASICYIFSLALLRSRLTQLGLATSPTTLRGLIPIVVGKAARFIGGYSRVAAIKGFTNIVNALGLFPLMGGEANVRWAWPSVVFRGSIIQLPWRLANVFEPSLQANTKTCSTYPLQALGFMVFAGDRVTDFVGKV